MEALLKNPCKGMNCGCTDGVSHSLECHAEHAASIAGGVFVKAEKPEQQAQAGAPLPWDHINDVLPVLVAAANGKWSWAGNMECKYVELRIDMRDGGCIIKNSRHERITQEQLRKQLWSHSGIPWDNPPAITQAKEAL